MARVRDAHTLATTLGVAVLVCALALVVPASALPSPPPALPAPNAADFACRDAGINVTVATLAAAMGVSPANQATWCANVGCEPVVEQLVVQLRAHYMDCPLRTAAFLAQVRHETAALTRMHQPIDDGAGLLHMLPFNFRIACRQLPDLRAAFVSEFSGQAGYNASDPCGSGSNANASVIVARPEFGVSTALWWMTSGSALLLEDACADVRGASDEGIGFFHSPVSDRAMTGFYLVSHCIFGFNPDSGLYQRVGYYNNALNVFGADSPPSVKLVAPAHTRLGLPTTSPTLGLSAVLTESLPAFATASAVAPSSGTVASVTAAPGGNNATFDVVVSGVSAGTVVVSVAAGAVVDGAGQGNARAASLSLQYDPAYTMPASATGYAFTSEDASAMSNGACNADCQANIIPHLNAALRESAIDSAWISAALLASIRHDTAAFSVFYIASTHRAGGVHISPAAIRLGCAQVASIEGAFAEEFAACAAVNDTCTCGSNADAGQLVAQPPHAMRLAAWYVAAGAEAVHGSACAGLAAEVESVGFGAPRFESSPPTGFYRLSECLREGGPTGDYDAGLGQRVTFFIDAAQRLLAPVTVSLATLTPITTSLPVTVTATFSQAVRVAGLSAADVAVTGPATAASWAPVGAVGGAGGNTLATKFTFQVTDGGGSVPYSDMNVTFASGVAHGAVAGAANADAALLKLSYEDPATSLVVTLTTSVASPASQRLMVFTATFSHDVVAPLTPAGVAASSGTVRNVAAVTPARAFTFEWVSPDSGGVTIMVAAAACTSANTGRGNHASNVVALEYQPTPCQRCSPQSPCEFEGVCYDTIEGVCPGGTDPCQDHSGVGFVNMSFTSSEPGPSTYSDPIPMVLRLSEPVRETVTAGMIQLSSGSVVDLVAVDAVTYTFGVSGAAVELLKVSMAAAVVTSVATLEGNTEPRPFTISVVEDPCDVCRATGTDVCNYQGACFAKSGGVCPAGTQDCTDFDPPIITLTGGAHVVVEGGGDAWTDPGATAYDAVSGDVTDRIVVVSGSVNVGAIGNTTVVYQVTDTSLNMAQTTRVVRVIDTLGPVVSLVGNASVTVEATAAADTYADDGATATDAVDGSLTPLLDATAVDTSAVGTYTAVWRAVDGSGNRGVVSRQVEVVDTTPPTITLSDTAAATVEAVATASYTETATATAVDIVDGILDASAVVLSTNVDTGVVGAYWSRWTATDAAGNVATVDRVVSVVDTTPPTVTLVDATPVVIPLAAAGSTITIPSGRATATDLVDGTVTVVADTSAVDVTTIGSYTAALVATDAAGNAALVSLTVEVAAPVTVTLVGSASVVLEAGVDTYSDAGATAVSLVHGALPAPTVSAPVELSQNPVPLGEYTVVYTATDDSGDTGSASRSVSATDTRAPVISLAGGASVTIAVGAAWEDPGATASDAVDGSVAVVVTGPAVVTSAAGTFTLTYTATDDAGNSASATRSVVVEATSGGSSGGGTGQGNGAGQEAGAAGAGPSGIDGFLCGAGCFVVLLLVALLAIAIVVAAVVLLQRRRAGSASSSTRVMPVITPGGRPVGGKSSAVQPVQSGRGTGRAALAPFAGGTPSVPTTAGGTQRSNAGASAAPWSSTDSGGATAAGAAEAEPPAMPRTQSWMQ